MDERIEDERLSAEYLEEGAALFLLLGRLFHGVPDPVLFAEAANDRIFDEMPFVRGEEALRAGACLRAWADRCSSPFSDDDFHEVSAEYARLFVGGLTVPAPMWQFLPTVARPPSTAPISIMEPSPMTEPMLMMAPIMMTARSPISTRSRMIVPGSMQIGRAHV